MPGLRIGFLGRVGRRTEFFSQRGHSPALGFAEGEVLPSKHANPTMTLLPDASPAVLPDTPPEAGPEKPARAQSGQLTGQAELLYSEVPGEDLYRFFEKLAKSGRAWKFVGVPMAEDSIYDGILLALVVDGRQTSVRINVDCNLQGRAYQETSLAELVKGGARVQDRLDEPPAPKPDAVPATVQAKATALLNTTSVLDGPPAH